MGKNDPFFLNATRLRTAHSYYDEIGRKPSVIEEVARVRSNLSSSSIQKLSRNPLFKKSSEILPTSNYSNEILTTDGYVTKSQLDVDFEIHSTSMTGILRMILSRFYRYMKYFVTGNMSVVPKTSTENFPNAKNTEKATKSTSVVNRNQSHISVTIDKNHNSGARISHENDECVCQFVNESRISTAHHFTVEVSEGKFTTVTEFSVEHQPDVLEEFVQNDTDVQSMVLSRRCASLIWIWNDKTRIILITESNDPKCWSVQQWYRKILSDMALTDSIMIRHPYYWHQNYRKKLNRVISHFKKLYRLLDEKKEQEKKRALKLETGDSVDLNKTIEPEIQRKPEKTQVIIQSSIPNQKNHQNLPAKDIAITLFDKWGNYKGEANNGGHIYSPKYEPSFLKQTITVVNPNETADQPFSSSSMTTAATEISLPHGTSLSFLSENDNKSANCVAVHKKSSCKGGFGDPN